MGNDRYQMTLEEIPGIILDIRQKGALMGTSTNRIESGYLLSNGTALLIKKRCPGSAFSLPFYLFYPHRPVVHHPGHQGGEGLGHPEGVPHAHGAKGPAQ